MSELILPKTYVEVELAKRVIFLAGPIRSAPNWQDKAIELLFKEYSSLVIVSPRRGVRENIAQYVVTGNDTYFERQRAWEQHYLELASKQGAIMFWLPGEEKHDCNKVYGAMTRIELGQGMTHYKYDNNVRVCFGTDGSFPEFSTIAYDLSIHAKDKKILTTLEETCQEAIKVANQKEK